MGEIMNSPKGVKSGVPDPHVEPVTNVVRLYIYIYKWVKS